MSKGFRGIAKSPNEVAEAINQSYLDAAIFGTGFLLTYSDGSVRSVHPSRVQIDGEKPPEVSQCPKA